MLPNLSPSQNVYFRQGTNVEFGNANGGTSEVTSVPPMEGYTLETLNPKTTDFSNPMYEAVQSGTLTEPSMDNKSGKFWTPSIKNKKKNLKNYFAGIYEVPADVTKTKPKVASVGPFTEPVSAILAPSSITHRTPSPKLQIRPRELNPSNTDTGKDTQQLVEEDKTDCW